MLAGSGKKIIVLTRLQWVLAIGTLAAVAVFYATVYRPQSQQLASLREQVDQRQTELRTSQTETSILPTVAADVERLRGKLDRVKTFPHQQELPQFIKDISGLGEQASLKRFEMTRGMPARGERLNELPVHLTFEGDFVSVYSFLQHAEEMQRMTRVPQIEIHAKDKSGLVKVTLTMNIYFAADEPAERP